MHPVHALVIPRRPARRLLAAALAAALTITSLAAAAGPVHASARGDGLRAAANERRADADVTPVVGTALLDSIAEARADQMRDAKELEHDMDYVRNRLVRADVCWTSFGEIIAWRSGGEYSYEGTITQWMNSDPHRHLMLGGSFNAAGGSWATANDGSHYSVMIFATLCASEVSRVALLQPSKRYDPDRQMVLTRGRHTAYRMAADGAVLDTRRVDLDSRVRPDSAGRVRLDGTAYLKVSSGRLAGYWVRESSEAYVRGMTQKRELASAHRLQLDPGTYTAYRFDALGRVTDARTARVDRHDRTRTTARAIINGRAWFRVSHGTWDGYWLRDTGAVDLAG